MQKENKNMLTCSIANITENDARVFAYLSVKLAEDKNKRWVVNIHFGFIVRPDMLKVPAMEMRNAGLSENTIMLLTEGRENYGADVFCFDRDGDPLEGWPVYERSF